jgi:rhodanese-related sulfurtransferase
MALRRPTTAPTAHTSSCGPTKACGAAGTLTADSHDEFQPINVLEAARGGALLLDVRSPAEFRSGRVQGAVNLPLEQVNAESVRTQMSERDNSSVLLLCASGGRAKVAAQKLKASGIRTFVIQGGTRACQQAGLPMEGDARSVMSVERQVRIAAGLMVFAGVALGTLYHPGFYGLSGFIGGGLMFAGITDWCGMGLLLARAPWNR